MQRQIESLQESRATELGGAAQQLTQQRSAADALRQESEQLRLELLKSQQQLETANADHEQAIEKATSEAASRERALQESHQTLQQKLQAASQQLDLANADHEQAIEKATSEAASRERALQESHQTLQQKLQAASQQLDLANADHQQAIEQATTEAASRERALQESNQTLQQKLQAASQQLDLANADHQQAIEKATTEAASRERALQESNQTLQQKLQAASQQLDLANADHQQAIEQATTEAASRERALQESNQKLQLAVEKLEASTQDFKKEIETAKIAMTTLDRSHQETIQALRQELQASKETHTSEIQQITGQLQQAGKDGQTDRAKVEYLQLELQQSQNQANAMAQQAQHLQTALSAQAEAHEHEAKQRQSEHQESLKSLQLEISNLQNNDRNEQSATLQQRQIDHERMESLQQELLNKTEAIATLTSQNQEVQQQFEELKDVTKELQVDRQSAEALQQANDELTATNASLRQQVEALEQQINALGQSSQQGTNAAKGALQDSQARCEALGNELRAANHAIQLLDQEKEQLQKTLDDERQVLANSEPAQKIPKLENEILRLSQQNQTLSIEMRRDIEEQKARAELFRQKLENATNEANALATDNSQLQQDVYHQAEALALRQEHQNTIAELESKLHEARQTKQTESIELRRDLDEQLADAELLRQKLRVMESNVETLEKEKAKLQKDYLGQAKDVATQQGHQQANETLRNELEELRSRKEEEIGDTRREMEKLKAANERLAEQLRTAIENAEELKSGKAALEQDVLAQAKELAAQSGWQANLESLQRELSQLKSVREDQDAKAIEANRLIEEQKAQREVLEQQLDASRNETEQLAAEIRDLEERLNKQADATEQTLTEQETMEVMHLELSGRQSQSEVDLATIRRELNIEKRKAEEARVKLENQQAAMEAVQTEREQLKQDLLRQSESLANQLASQESIQELQAQKSELAIRLQRELEQAKQRLRERAAEHESQNAKNDTAIEELKKKLDGYEASVLQIQSEKQEFAEAVEALTADVATKSKQAFELRQTVDALEEALGVAQANGDSIDGLKIREQELQAKLDAQLKASSRLESEHVDLQSQYAQLEAKLTAKIDQQADALQVLREEKDNAVKNSVVADNSLAELRSQLKTLDEKVVSTEAGHQQAMDRLKAENEEFKRSVAELHAISNEYDELKLTRKQEQQTARERLQEATTANAELSVEIAGLREKLQIQTQKTRKSSKARRTPKPEARQLEIDLKPTDDQQGSNRQGNRPAGNIPGENTSGNGGKAEPAKRRKRPRGTNTSAKSAVVAETRMLKDENLGMIYAARPDEIDDLKQITGVGPVLERRLQSAGIYRFEQVVDWSDATIAYLDKELSLGGRIEREDWVSQAKALVRKKA